MQLAFFHDMKVLAVFHLALQSSWLSKVLRKFWIRYKLWKRFCFCVCGRLRKTQRCLFNVIVNKRSVIREFTQLRRKFIFFLNHKIPGENGLISGAYRSKWISKLSFFKINVSNLKNQHFFGIKSLCKIGLDFKFARGKINFHQSLTLGGKTDNLTRSRIDPDKPK